MARRSLFAIAAAATLVLAACSEREPEGTTGPELAPSSTDPCGFSNSLIANYFPSSRQSTIVSLKQSMANAGRGTTNAQTFGFQILDSIGSVSRNFSISPSAGAQLTVAVVGCMFTGTFTYPNDNAVSAFTAALNNAAGGAYYVRGGGRQGIVLGRLKPLVGDETNLSGIETSSSTWPSMSSTAGTSVGTALIYGYPVTSSPLVFEWATVPSALTFSPEVVISVCDGDNSQTAMVHEQDIGVLAYFATTICEDGVEPLAMNEQNRGPRSLAARLGRIFARAIIPTPLQAATLLTGTGGKTSNVPKSTFGKKTVSTLTLTWVSAPPAVIKGPDDPSTTNPLTEFPVSFTVETEAGDPIAGTCAYLAGTNNNGAPTMLTGPHATDKCTNPPGGDTGALSVLLTRRTINQKVFSIADFGKVGVTKTGGIIFSGSADVLDRAGAGLTTPIKSNVKPLGK